MIILAVIVLSTIVAIFFALGNFINKKTFSKVCDAFFYSFLGGLFGGFTGLVVCNILGYFFYPSISYFLLEIVGLVIGVIIGGITTIQPLIKFFSDDLGQNLLGFPMNDPIYIVTAWKFFVFSPFTLFALLILLSD